MADNPYKLSSGEHDSFYQEVKARYLSRGQSVSQPVAIITGGQPGSGKSGITEIAKAQLRNNGGYVLVDADKIRNLHPHYRYLAKTNDREAANLTHADAGAWSSKLVKDAQSLNKNLIIDQTSRDASALERLASTLKGNGYRVELHVMAVNPRISEQRIHYRYEIAKARGDTARFSTKENHDVAVLGVGETVKAMEQMRALDKVALYDKDVHRIYENERREGEWINPPKALQAFQMERERKLSVAELGGLADRYAELRDMLEDPRRRASVTEKDAMRVRLTQARVELAHAIGKDVSLLKAALSSGPALDEGKAAFKQSYLERTTSVELAVSKDEVAKPLFDAKSRNDPGLER